MTNGNYFEFTNGTGDPANPELQEFKCPTFFNNLNCVGIVDNILLDATVSNFRQILSYRRDNSDHIARAKCHR